MANYTVYDSIETGELILQVDDTRAAGDPFQLFPELRTVAEERLAAAKGANTAVTFTEGDRVGAAVRVKEALADLREALRDGYKHITALPKGTLPEADRQGALATYGWQRGLLGSLQTAARVESLANLSVGAATVVPAAARYPAAVQARIASALGVLNENQPVAKTGQRSAAVKTRDTALEALALSNARVRFWYCCATDETDKTGELARINYQPRREAGDAQPHPRPDAPVGATYDAATKTLSVAEMPAHATTLRAMRQAEGGAPFLAGLSTGTTVPVDSFGPLAAGVTYAFWLVGHNSRGDGPESNRITATLPVPA